MYCKSLSHTIWGCDLPEDVKTGRSIAGNCILKASESDLSGWKGHSELNLENHETVTVMKKIC